VEHVHTDVYGVATNNVFTGAFRGFGSPAVNFSVEQLLDMAAEKCGLDPVEIRRRNMVVQDAETITGQKLDNHTVSMGPVMDAALEKIEFESKVNNCSYGKGEQLYGIGFGICYRGASLGAEGKDFCSCVLNCQFDGSILLETGIWENGQGSQSAMMLVLAEELGVDLERIRYLQSTTSHIPDSGTTVASRGTLMGSGAVCDAVRKLETIICETLAPVLGCTPGQVEIRDDRVWGRDTSLSWEEAMAEMFNARVYPYAFGSFRAPEIDWDEETGSGNPYFTYVYSAQAVEVTVEAETGKITVGSVVAAHDIGRAVNPHYLKGQIYGGITQGAGMALTEEFSTGEGTIRSLNFNTYRIPKATELPDIEAIIVENRDPTSPHGCKGIGEPALEIIAPALANAVYRATGKRQFRLPFGRPR
jgi:CO/xanthine dehydrogenase Mo-binding subunit